MGCNGKKIFKMTPEQTQRAMNKISKANKNIVKAHFIGQCLVLSALCIMALDFALRTV